MASRSKKSTTTKITETTEKSSGFSSASTSGTPLTPTRATRLEEKHQLQSLNDRLASYIERVRQLELENRTLNAQVKTQQENVTKEVTTVKCMYDKELTEARRLLDETAKEKAKLQIEANTKKTENDELKTKFNKAKKDLQAAEKRLSYLESQNQDLQTRLSQAVAEKSKFENNLKEATAEINALSEQLSKAKQQLEDETLLRVDAENKVMSLREELAFRETFYEKELSESRLIISTEVSQLDNRLKDHYEEQMADNLRELRDSYEDQMRQNRKEVENIFNAKIEDLSKQVDALTRNASTTRDEAYSYRTKVESLQSKLLDLEAQNNNLVSRTKDLERMLEQEREWNQSSLREKDEELAKLRAQIDKQLKEFQDLLDTKVALASELAVYSKLLGSEESRLNLSTTGTPTARVGGKRRITTLTEKQQSSSEDAATTHGDIEIVDQDPAGKFIKIINNGKEDIPIGGWQLIRSSGDLTSHFKFHRSVVAKPNFSITVWSSNTGAIHSPPHDFVMKGSNWIVSDSVTAVLKNSDGQEMATRLTARNPAKRFRTHETEGTEEDAQSPERCCIM